VQLVFDLRHDHGATVSREMRLNHTADHSHPSRHLVFPNRIVASAAAKVADVAEPQRQPASVPLGANVRAHAHCNEETRVTGRLQEPTQIPPCALGKVNPASESSVGVGVAASVQQQSAKAPTLDTLHLEAHTCAAVSGARKTQDVRRYETPALQCYALAREALVEVPHGVNLHQVEPV
jgi:hypothetical protein